MKSIFLEQFLIASNLGGHFNLSVLNLTGNKTIITTLRKVSQISFGISSYKLALKWSL